MKKTIMIGLFLILGTITMARVEGEDNKLNDIGKTIEININLSPKVPTEATFEDVDVNLNTISIEKLSPKLPTEAIFEEV
jgi:hypothetical protein